MDNLCINTLRTRLDFEENSFMHKLWLIINVDKYDFIRWSFDGKKVLLNLIELEEYLESDNSIFLTKNCAAFMMELGEYDFKRLNELFEDDAGNLLMQYQHKGFQRESSFVKESLQSNLWTNDKQPISEKYSNLRSILSDQGALPKRYNLEAQDQNLKPLFVASSEVDGKRKEFAYGPTLDLEKDSQAANREELPEDYYLWMPDTTEGTDVNIPFHTDAPKCVQQPRDFSSWVPVKFDDVVSNSVPIPPKTDVKKNEEEDFDELFERLFQKEFPDFDRNYTPEVQEEDLAKIADLNYGAAESDCCIS